MILCVLGLLIGMLSVPLALGLIPPNRHYGLRVPGVTDDPAVWYSLNRIFGFYMLAIGIIEAGLGLWHYMRPTLSPAWMIFGLILPVLGSIPMVIYAGSLWGVGLAGGYSLALTDWLVPAMGVTGFWLASAAGLTTAGLGVLIYFARVSQSAK